MKRVVLVLAAVFAAVFALVTPAFGAALQTVYNSATLPTPGNYASVGVEAYAFSEFGDEVTLAGGATRGISAVVGMSSWACQSGAWNTNDCASANGSFYEVPITLSFYNASSLQGDNTVRPGTLIGRVTQTQQVPYRPSANVQHCHGAALGKWWDKKTSTCFNGKAVNLTFNIKGITLPSTVVYGISYNTTHYGPSPIGEGAACYGTPSGCPYDSLNIALNDAAPSVGSQVTPGTVFQNAEIPGVLCDGTPAVGVFNQDSPTDGCWPGSVPVIKITAR